MKLRLVLATVAVALVFALLDFAVCGDALRDRARVDERVSDGAAVGRRFRPPTPDAVVPEPGDDPEAGADLRFVRVCDAVTGESVAGVSVRHGDPPSDALDGGMGTFLVPGGAALTVTAEGPSHLPATRHLSADADGVVEIVLARARSYAVQLRDAVTKQPLQGSVAAWHQPSTDAIDTAQTDGAGVARLRVPPGAGRMVVLRAAAPRHVSRHLVLDPADAAGEAAAPPRIVELEPGCRVRLTVLAAESRTPLEGAVVLVDRRAVARTDSRGRAEVVVPAPEHAEIVALTAEGRPPTALVLDSAGATLDADGVPAKDVLVLIAPPGKYAVRGFVLLDDRPVSGAAVSATLPLEAFTAGGVALGRESVVLTAVTNEAGEFAFPLVVHMQMLGLRGVVVATLPDGRTIEAEVQIGADARVLELRAAPPARVLRVRLRRDDQIAPRGGHAEWGVLPRPFGDEGWNRPAGMHLAEPTVWRRTALLADRAVVEVAVPLADSRVRFSAWDEDCDATRVLIGPDTPDDLEIVLVPTALVAGRVVDAYGQAVPRAFVSVYEGESYLGAAAMSGPDGGYVLRFPRARTRVEVEIRARHGMDDQRRTATTRVSGFPARQVELVLR